MERPGPMGPVSRRGLFGRGLFQGRDWRSDDGHRDLRMESVDLYLRSSHHRGITHSTETPQSQTFLDIYWSIKTIQPGLTTH